MTTKRIIVPKNITGSYSIAPLATPTDPYSASIANAKASLLNPSQQRTVSNQQTTAQINAQLGASNASSKAEQSQFGSLADHAAALAQAIGSFGPQYGQADQDAYNQAANTIGQLGTGLTGAVASDWQAQTDAANASVQKVLGPSAQITTYDPAQLRSSAQYLGVTQPGTTLAQQALNERNLQIYGNQADMAQVQTISQSYIAQAAQALQQRAAERASIIAQRPELFQQALAAQKADNVQTQNHIDSLVAASQTALLNKQREADTRTNANRSWLATQIGLTHIDPRTGQPTGGYVWADKDHSAVVPWTSKTAATETDASTRERIREFNATQKLNESNAAAAAKTEASKAAQVGTYNEGLSKQAGYLVDGKGKPFLDTKGQRIPWTPTKSASATKNAANGGLTPNESVSVTGKIKAAIKTGFTGNPGQALYEPNNPAADDSGFIYRPGTSSPKLSYQDAMQAALDMAPNPVWRKRITQWVDQQYPEGQGGRPYSAGNPQTKPTALKVVKKMLAQGKTYAQAVAEAHASSAFPYKISLWAINQVYASPQPTGPTGPTGTVGTTSSGPAGLTGPTR